MTEPSEYEWTMMRFKTSLSLGLKEIKIIEISHKNPRLHSIGLLVVVKRSLAFLWLIIIIIN